MLMQTCENLCAIVHCPLSGRRLVVHGKTLWKALIVHVIHRHVLLHPISVCNMLFFLQMQHKVAG